MRLSRRRRKTNLTVPEVTLTPLIDTALNLLIIFMITTPMIHNAIKVNLPRGKIKEDAGAIQDLCVYVEKADQAHNKGERLYINGTAVTSKDLIAELKRRVGNEQGKMVYIKADRDVKHGTVTEIVDQIKCIEGIAHVALATQRA
ncbi:MAG TPA: biopolymer transporter ExbD [Candidatus Dependentiae bacterium]|jgi:biopolymer transport protein ExbD|nr:biopolymer transporter ExbD [Candidatus Dependentiae bacterium]